MSYPCLSIKQPWAWLIVQGFKDVENRTWRSDYRGPLLIHTGKTFDAGFDFAWGQKMLDRLHPGAMLPRRADYPLGGIVGRCELVDCVVRSDSPWHFAGNYGFVLHNPEPLPFEPAKGALGLFWLDDVPEAKRPAPAPAQGQGSLL